MKRKRDEIELIQHVLKKFKHCRKRNMENDLNEIFKKIKLNDYHETCRKSVISENQQRRDILVYT